MIGAVACYFTTHALGAEGLYAESLRAGPRGLFDRPLDSVTVGDLMRPQPAPLRIDTRFGEIARNFLRSPDCELWIADHAGKLAGAVFLDTVRPYLQDPHVAETVIALDILNTTVTPIRASDSLTRALERFTHEPYDTLPVTDDHDRLLGSLVREDLLLTISEMARRERVLR
jgi:CBS-domain-containing membrane protein